MIRLAHVEPPDTFRTNAKAWTKEYVKAVGAGDDPPARYRRDDVRDALRAETHAKCAYCEAAIEHVTFSHIEHIIPKTHVPALVCEWSNLTLACPKCNTYKGTYYDPSAPLINPYSDDPATSLTFFGPMLIHRTPMGQLTIARLRLNRSELTYRRTECAREIARILDLMQRATGDPAVTAALLSELADRLSAASEYSACARTFVGDLQRERNLQLDTTEFS